MEIITGRTGTPHVYAADDAEIYKLFLGDGDYRLTTGNQLSAIMVNPQEVRINDGSLMMQGRLAKIRPSDGYDTVNLDSGTTGLRRADLIVAEYNQTTETHQEEIEGEVVSITDVLESVTLKVLKGTPNATAYNPPTVTTGNIDNGETHQVALWEVRFDGINNAGLIDRRPALLDTTPIQAAVSLATSSIAQIQSQMDTLSDDVADYISTMRTDVLAYADELSDSVASGFRGMWRKTVAVAQGDAASTIAVSIDNYTYTARDIVEVYLEGLRLVPTEYSVAGSGSTVSITLTSGTFVGQMEVVVFRISEAA